MGPELDIHGLRSQVWTGDRMEVIRTRAGWAGQPGNAVGTGPSPHVNFPGKDHEGTQEVQPRRDPGRPWLSSILLTRRTQGMLTVPALAPPVCAGGWGKSVDRLLTVC